MITCVVGTEGLPWKELFALYEAVGLVANLPGTGRDEEIRRAFEASHRVVTAFAEGRLVGAGRLISDGVCYGLVVDVGVLPSYERRGVGRAMMERLIDEAHGLRLHLTSTFGKEGFYEKLGFRKHKTAYALFPGRSPYLEE